MYGLGLVYLACGLILRYAARYYAKHRDSYTSEQVEQIDALIDAAQQLQNLLAPFFIPKP